MELGQMKNCTVNGMLPQAHKHVFPSLLLCIPLLREYAVRILGLLGFPCIFLTLYQLTSFRLCSVCHFLSEWHVIADRAKWAFRCFFFFSEFCYLCWPNHLKIQVFPFNVVCHQHIPSLIQLTLWRGFSRSDVCVCQSILFQDLCAKKKTKFTPAIRVLNTAHQCWNICKMHQSHTLSY